MKEKNIIVKYEDVEFLQGKIKGYNLSNCLDYRLINRVVYQNCVNIYGDFNGYRKSSYILRRKDDEFLFVEFHGDLYFKKFSDGTKKIEKEHSQYDAIIYENAMLRYERIGELEFLKECNEFRYKNIFTVRKNLENTRDKIDPGEPEFISYNEQIEILNRWIEIYSSWFLHNGYDIPGIEITNTTDANQTQIEKKEEWRGYKQDLIEECIRKFVRVEFETKMDAFKWAASKFRFRRKDLDPYQLKSYYDVLKKRGIFWEKKGNYYRKDGKEGKIIK